MRVRLTFNFFLIVKRCLFTFFEVSVIILKFKNFPDYLNNISIKKGGLSISNLSLLKQQFHNE